MSSQPARFPQSVRTPGRSATDGATDLQSLSNALETPTSWLDTIAFDHSTGLEIPRSAQSIPVLRRAGHPLTRPRTAPAEPDARTAQGKSRKSRGALSLWHRPLGAVIEHALGEVKEVATKVLKRAADRAAPSATPPTSAATQRAVAPIGPTQPAAESRALPALRTREAGKSPMHLLKTAGSSNAGSLFNKALHALGDAYAALVKPKPNSTAIAHANVNRYNNPAPSSRPASLDLQPSSVRNFVASRPFENSRPPPFATGGRESVSPFRQQLYADAAMTLSFDPSGMGVLWLRTAAGVEHNANPEAKWYFVSVLRRFEELGEAANSANPRYVAMTKSFAQALLAYPPADPAWKDMVADDPKLVARCFAGLDKPTSPVVEVPASAIHRTSAAGARIGAH